jgi:hypothetical protein
MSQVTRRSRGPSVPRSLRAIVAHGMEVVLDLEMNELIAEDGALHVSRAEVDTAPGAGVYDLLQRGREAVEGARLAGAGDAPAAGRRKRHLVRAEERLQGIDDGAADAGVSGRLVREAWRNEWSSGDGDRRVD